MKENSNIKKIVVVGSGAFGTAIAEVLVRGNENKVKEKEKEIVLFGIDKREINDINKNHKNSKYYSMRLSPNLVASTDPVESFKDADIIMLVIPSKVFKIALEESVVPNLVKPAFFINLAKGLDYENNKILTKVIDETIPKKFNNGSLKLSGASYASELVHKAPTSFILSSSDIEISKMISKELNNYVMKISPENNLVSVEWLSVVKNPLAILMGLISGLGYKMNTKALFFTEAIIEMKKVIKHFGLKEEVVFSPAGIGDLYLTGSSRKSRNFTTGYNIGKANKVTKKALKTFETTEGLRSIKTLNDLSKKHNLGLTSIEMLYNITYKKEKPSEAVKNYIDNF